MPTRMDDISSCGYMPKEYVFRYTFMNLYPLYGASYTLLYHTLPRERVVRVPSPCMTAR